MADTRSTARRLISEGRVRVGGVVAPKPATMVSPDTPVELTDDAARFVSRGGEKLDHALDVFGIDVTDARAVDLGASTGGFTDCLIQRGAATVTAIDVGYNQLDYRLRNHTQVEVHERTNARTMDPAEFGEPFDIVVGDLSFISLELVMGVVRSLVLPTGNVVLLVKPQFEVGRDQVGRGGLVSDPALWNQSIMRIIDAAGSHGLGACGIVASPLRGASAGNREFLLWVRPGPPTMAADAIELALVNDSQESAP